MVITLIAAAVVVLVPGVAAAWWTRCLTGGIEHVEDQSLEPGQLIGLVYAGLGVAAIALWLGSVAFGLSGWTSVAMPLGVAGVLALGAVRGTRASGRVAATGASVTEPQTSGAREQLGTIARRPVMVLATLSLISVCVVAIPFSTYGLERADGIHRMAMTDWEKHIIMTTGVAASREFPPPHPFIHADADPSYYFGYHLVAAAIDNVTGDSGDVYLILLLLTLVTAAATPFVVYTFSRDLCDAPRALIAAAGATLLTGFDAVVMALEAVRAVAESWPLSSGLAGLRAVVPSTHLDFWIHNVDRQFSAPIIATMWAPHQTAAALIALLIMYLLAPRKSDPGRARAGWLLPALLLAALPGLSAYVALGLAAGVLAATIAESAAERYTPWRTTVFSRWAFSGLVAIVLALPIVPTLVSGSSSGLVLHVSSAGTWSNGALFSWLFGPRWWTNLLDTPAVYFVDFGIIGLLGTQQMLLLRRQHRMSPAQRQAACVVVAILLLVTFVRPPVGIGNNLYARAPLLAWFVAAPFAAMRATHVGRASWIGVAALVCVFGTAYADVGYLLEGRLFWAVEREHVEALRWVNHNTPRGSLVAIRPGDSQSNVGLWLRRPMVLGGRRLAILFGADPELFGRTEASLERAYLSSSGMEAARRFDDLNADVIYVRHENGDPAWASPPCFDVGYRNTAWIVVVRHRPACGDAPE